VNEDLQARIFAFIDAVNAGSSTRIEPWRYGNAYFNADYPISYAHNFLDVVTAPDDVSATELEAEADRILGRAGYEHRTLVVRSDGLGTRLRDRLASRGWSPEHIVVMVHARAPERLPDTSAVENFDFAAVRPARLEMTRAEPYADSEDTVEQLVDRLKATSGAVHVRHYGVRAGSTIVSLCDLYSDGTTAQIEDVGTLEQHRGRGYARAVVWKAVEVARSESHELVFLLADDDDWPKEMYAKLGFDPLTRYWEFSLRPEDARRAATRS
jgi:GNAT superfamily N-acetyltransferase